MQYPLISEYIEAIRSAEDNFDELNNFRPVLDDYGNPIMSSGNFAVVFKMQDVNTGKFFAVKCFIKEQEGRGERYAKISEELEFVSSSYILNARYMEHELFVSTPNCDEEEFPVLVMDWVDGQPLDEYLRQHINDKYELQMLAYRFCQMGAWLLAQPFAHGDLKPDNIIVREDGSLVLVDYDGMFVPSMKGEKAHEIGSPDFRHPLRSENDFDEHIDDFSIASIALSLKAISLKKELYNEYDSPDKLLFSAKDYQDIGRSPVLHELLSIVDDSELTRLLSAFLLVIAEKNLCMLSFRSFIISKVLPKQDFNQTANETSQNVESNIVTTWPLLSFANGKRMQLGSFLDKQSNNYYKLCIFTDEKTGERIFCSFSQEIGELTAKEISKRKYELQIEKLSSGFYRLTSIKKNKEYVGLPF